MWLAPFLRPHAETKNFNSLTCELVQILSVSQMVMVESKIPEWSGWKSKIVLHPLGSVRWATGKLASGKLEGLEMSKPSQSTRVLESSCHSGATVAFCSLVWFLDSLHLLCSCIVFHNRWKRVSLFSCVPGLLLTLSLNRDGNIQYYEYELDLLYSLTEHSTSNPQHGVLSSQTCTRSLWMWDCQSIQGYQWGSGAHSVYCTMLGELDTTSPFPSTLLSWRVLRFAGWLLPVRYLPTRTIFGTIPDCCQVLCMQDSSVKPH